MKKITRDIISIVAKNFELKKSLLVVSCKTSNKEVESLARQLVLYALYCEFNFTQKGAAQELNYKSHGSVGHAVRKIEERIDWDCLVSKTIKEIQKLK